MQSEAKTEKFICLGTAKKSEVKKWQKASIFWLLKVS